MARPNYGRRSKYGAKRIVTHDGQKFASKREYEIYCERCWEVKAGVVWDLERQVRFDFIVNGKKVGWYTLDFVYRRKDVPKKVAEEVKGYAARDYALRRNLFKALFPEYQFVETK